MKKKLRTVTGKEWDFDTWDGKIWIEAPESLESADFPESCKHVEEGHSFPRRPGVPFLFGDSAEASALQDNVCSFHLLPHFILTTKLMTWVIFQLKLVNNVTDLVKEKGNRNKYIF